EKAVLPLLDHANPSTRVEACGVLKVVGTRESVPALEKAARDPDINVARAAAETLRAVQARPWRGMCGGHGDSARRGAGARRPAARLHPVRLAARRGVRPADVRLAPVVLAVDAPSADPLPSAHRRCAALPDPRRLPLVRPPQRPALGLAAA